MKVHLYLVCGSGQDVNREDVQYAFVHREDWLREIRYRLEENCPADLANLNDKQIYELVILHTDDTAVVVDLVGPKWNPDSYQGFCVLYRPAGTLDRNTSFDGVIGAYSSPAALPQPLLDGDEITMVTLQDVKDTLPDWRTPL